jgi:Urease alpha-subunit, N-terminal domain
MPDSRNAWAALLRYVGAFVGSFLACAASVSLAADSTPPAYDLIIEHGRVIDGTGAPWFAADVGIRAGRIAAIGRLDNAAAKQRINAAGRVVAPGFIDMLGQSELTLLVNPHVPSKIFQGITTEITGEGESVAPVNAAIAREWAAKFRHYGITHKATFGAPKQLSVGMHWVLVNGVPVIADGVSTDALPGRVLRGQAYQATR